MPASIYNFGTAGKIDIWQDRYLQINIAMVTHILLCILSIPVADSHVKLTNISGHLPKQTLVIQDFSVLLSQAARREMERQRQLEWERQRRDQLMAEKQREHSQVDRLHSEVGELKLELEALVSFPPPVYLLVGLLVLHG